MGIMTQEFCEKKKPVLYMAPFQGDLNYLLNMDIQHYGLLHVHHIKGK